MRSTRILRMGALCLCLALALTACSPKEVLKDVIVSACTALGFIDGEASQEDEAEETMAQPGGDVTFPEGMNTTDERLVTQVEGDSLYVAFNGIQNRSTDYFVPAGDSLTITGYGSTESTTLKEFKVALWELSEDQTKTSYVTGSTVYYPTDGTNYTYTITGLTPGKQYKVYISYDSGSFYITGGLKVQGLGSEELTTIEEEE